MLDPAVPGSGCFPPGVSESFNALCKGGLTRFADEWEGGGGRGDAVRSDVGSTEGDDFDVGMAGDFAGDEDEPDPVKELGVRRRPTRTEAARDAKLESLPFPCPDLVRILKPRPRPVAADSDPLALVYPALVYPCADSDALSLPDVNLCVGDRGVDTAILRPLGVGDLASYGPAWPGK